MVIPYGPGVVVSFLDNLLLLRFYTKLPRLRSLSKDILNGTTVLNCMNIVFIVGQAIVAKSIFIPIIQIVEDFV